jgi:hypothetical protein
MAKAIIILLFLAWSGPGLAAGPGAAADKPLTVKSCGGKKISVAQGTQKRVIDLGHEVSGCTELYDPAEPKQRIHDSIRVGTIDHTFQDRKHYLVIWAMANANCNVQGHCGAGEDCTVVWLRLDESLKPEKRQAVVVKECRAETGIPDMDEENPGACLQLAQGKLLVKFGDLITDTPAWSQLLYEKEACVKGLIVIAAGSETL